MTPNEAAAMLAECREKLHERIEIGELIEIDAACLGDTFIRQWFHQLAALQLGQLDRIAERLTYGGLTVHVPQTVLYDSAIRDLELIHAALTGGG